MIAKRLPDDVSTFAESAGVIASLAAVAVSAVVIVVAADDEPRQQFALHTRWFITPSAALILAFCALDGWRWRRTGAVLAGAVTIVALGASVVYYGTSPNSAALDSVRAPVLGLYGENDARVDATIPPADSVMKRLQKTYEPHIMPELLELACPVMRRGARFHANQARRQFGKELKNSRSTNAPADDHRAISIDAVNLKHQLRNINPDRDNLAHGRLPS